MTATGCGATLEELLDELEELLDGALLEELGATELLLGATLEELGATLDELGTGASELELGATEDGTPLELAGACELLDLLPPQPARIMPTRHNSEIGNNFFFIKPPY